ncbi:MAG: hypothetical protein Q8O71_03840 [bacterium]|nr:hypothetical protein [bacterium]
MAYTPELTYKASSTLRRIAWSLNKPMTKTMEWILTDLIKFIPAPAICEACKDQTKCETCPFNTNGKPTGGNMPPDLLKQSEEILCER